MEKEIKTPLIVVRQNDDDEFYDDADKENIEVSVHQSSQYFENFYLNNNLPPHNSKRITKIVCSSDTKYVVTFSEEDKSIHGWPINDDFENEKDGREGKELRYDAKFQKDELVDLLMVSNDRYTLVRLSGKEQDEFSKLLCSEKIIMIFLKEKTFFFKTKKKILFF